jgi:membrane protease YdiL (CAAX protease family)
VKEYEPHDRSRCDTAPCPHSPLRRWVARHPVAAFLVMVYPLAIVFARERLIFGPALLTALIDTWPLLVTVIVPDLLLRIVFLNLAEEIGWTGFLQAHLQERHGPLRACALKHVTIW